MYDVEIDDMFWLVVTAGFCMFYMAWGIGANDIANCFGSAYGSGALSLTGCIIIASICEFAGAVLLGSHVSTTIRKGIVDIDEYEGDDGRVLMIVGMSSVLFSAATWLVLSSYHGLPVSTTHSAVGGVIAFGIVTKGYGVVNWEKVGLIILSWFISPVSACIFSAFLVSLLNRYVLPSMPEDDLKSLPPEPKLACDLKANDESLSSSTVDSVNTPRRVSGTISEESAELESSPESRVLPSSPEKKVQKEEEKGEVMGIKGRDKDNLRRSVTIGPFLMFVLSFVCSLFTFYKGGKGVGLDDTSVLVALGISFGVAFLMAILTIPISQYIVKKLLLKESTKKSLREDDCEKALEKEDDRKEGTEDTCSPCRSPISEECENKVEGEGGEMISQMSESQVAQSKLPLSEKYYCGYVWIVSAILSIAHGGNDVANSVGPFGAVLAANEGELDKTSSIPLWVFAVAGVGIVFGLGMYGRNVMLTIGRSVTSDRLRPSQAFCSGFSATVVILIATKLGIPISTTHASVGAVMGAGIGDVGIKKGVDWKVMGKIFSSWLLTLPFVGLTTAGTFAFLFPCVVDTPLE